MAFDHTQRKRRTPKPWVTSGGADLPAVFIASQRPTLQTRVGPKRCYIYARVSDDEETMKSVAGQLAEGEASADAQGMIVAGRFLEHGVTGMTDDRSELARLRALLPKREAEVVVVTEASRLGRDEKVLHTIYNELVANGFELYVTAKGFLNHDTFAIEAFMAAMDRRTRLRALNKGKKGSIAAGIPQNRPIFGYMYHPVTKEHTPHPRWAEGVRFLFECLDKGMSDTDTALAMTGRYPTPEQCHRADCEQLTPEEYLPWTCTMIEQVARNIRYRGDLVWGLTKGIFADDRKTRIKVERMPREHWVTGHNERLVLVDKETWERVNISRQMRRGPEGGANYRRPIRKHMFSALIRCGHCGVRMYYAPGDEHLGPTASCRSVGCPAHSKGRLFRQPIGMIERATLAVIDNELLHEDNVATIRAARATAQAERERRRLKSLGSLRRRLAAVDQEITDTIAAARGLGASTESAANAIREAEAQREHLTDAIICAAPPVPLRDPVGSLSELRRVLDGISERCPFVAATPDEFDLQQCLRDVVVRIDVFCPGSVGGDTVLSIICDTDGGPGSEAFPLRASYNVASLQTRLRVAHRAASEADRNQRATAFERDFPTAAWSLVEPVFEDLAFDPAEAPGGCRGVFLGALFILRERPQAFFSKVPALFAEPDAFYRNVQKMALCHWDPAMALLASAFPEIVRDLDTAAIDRFKRSRRGRMAAVPPKAEDFLAVARTTDNPGHRQRALALAAAFATEGRYIDRLAAGVSASGLSTASVAQYYQSAVSFGSDHVFKPRVLARHGAVDPTAVPGFRELMETFEDPYRPGKWLYQSSIVRWLREKHGIAVDGRQLKGILRKLGGSVSQFKAKAMARALADRNAVARLTTGASRTRRTAGRGGAS